MSSSVVNLTIKLRSFNDTSIDKTIENVLGVLFQYSREVIGPMPNGRGLEDFSPEKPLQFEKKVRHKQEEFGKTPRRDVCIIATGYPSEAMDVIHGVKLETGVGMEISVSRNGLDY